MKILITGGGGFLGSKLAQALLARGKLGGRAIASITLLDGAFPPAAAQDGRLKAVTGDVSDPGVIAGVCPPDTEAVFHLAAVVSGAAEADFDLGMRVNLKGTELLLAQMKKCARPPRLVYTSSVAAFGGALPAVLDDSTTANPQTSYGTQKVIGEYLVSDYSRKGYLDGRSLRLPTIVVRAGKPNAAASSFASGIIREPLNGVVSANGGVGYLSYLDQGIGFFKGSGSGGAIRFVAPTIQGTGRIEIQGGVNCAQAGRIRVEAQTLGGNLQYSPSPSEGLVRTNVNQLGPVWAGSTPALVNVPTLTITSVGGMAAPSTPGGLYSVADLTLPPGTSNPVPVVVTGSNIPPGSVFTLILIPQFAISPPINGTFSTGLTATVSIDLPLAQTALLNAFASITLPQLSKLLPLIDGEEIERVMVAGGFGTSAPPVLITKSGKEVPVAQLSQDDQLKVALAFEAMRTGAN